MFLAMSAAMLAVVGCSKENMVSEDVQDDINEDNVPEQGVIAPQKTVTAFSRDTKTSLDGLGIVWAEGDEISLFNEGGQPCTYTLSSGAGTPSGEFTTENEPEEGYMYAIYPVVTTAAEGKTMGTEIQQEQAYAASGFPTAYPMAAVSPDGKEFSFENLATVLKLHLVGNASVESISITAKGEGESLAGAAKVDFTTGTPVMTVSGSNTVTLTCAEPVQLGTEPTEFSFVVAPGNYAGGFDITVSHDSDNETTISTAAASVTFRPGTVKEFGGSMGVYSSDFDNIYMLGDGTFYSAWNLDLMVSDPAAEMAGTDESGEEVDYDNWSSKFTPQGNGIWSWTGVLAPGTFKFPWMNSFDNFFGVEDSRLVYHPGGTAGDPKLTIGTAGNYTITLDLNKLTIDVKTNFTYEVPERLYLIGNGTTCGWNQAEAIEMTSLGDGKFHIETTLEVPSNENDGFKFIFSRDTWDGFRFAWGLNRIWQGCSDRKNNTAFQQGAGTYSITADTKNWTYEITKM